MGKYISITDDNESDLTLATFLVEQEGFVAIARNDGYATLDAIADESIFMFIIDLQMPNIKGVDLIRRIRRMQKFKNSLILVMSARRETRDVKSALDAGANDYIVKPIDPEIFKNKLINLSGSVDRQWADFPVPHEEGINEVAVLMNCKASTISEVSLVVMSPFALEVGSTKDIRAEILEKIGIPQVTVRIKSCDKVNGMFQIRFEFVGMVEGARQKIRLYCRELAIKNRAS